VKGRFLAGTAVVILIGSALLLVLCYNTWSYCCGRCTLGTFLTLGPFSALLLALILVAALVLAVLRRRRRLLGRDRCACGAALDRLWRWCPACGARRGE